MMLPNYKEQTNVTAADVLTSQVIPQAVARNYYFTQVRKYNTGHSLMNDLHSALILTNII